MATLSSSSRKFSELFKKGAGLVNVAPFQGTIHRMGLVTCHPDSKKKKKKKELVLAVSDYSEIYVRNSNERQGSSQGEDQQNGERRLMVLCFNHPMRCTLVSPTLC